MYNYNHWFLRSPFFWFSRDSIMSHRALRPKFIHSWAWGWVWCFCEWRNRHSIDHAKCEPPRGTITQATPTIQAYHWIMSRDYNGMCIQLPHLKSFDIIHLISNYINSVVLLYMFSLKCIVLPFACRKLVDIHRLQKPWHSTLNYNLVTAFVG